MTKTTQRNTTKTNAPKPSVAPDQSAAGDIVMAQDTQHGEEGQTVVLSEDASNVVAMSPGKGVRKSIFAEAAKEVSQQAVAKVTVMQDVRQKLAQASDLYNEGDDKAKEAKEIADDAATRLYQARIDGLASGDEVSGVLGDIFGYKEKKDGTPSKTPMGQGEAIRKRIVRATQAAEFVRDGTGSRFFEGIEPSAIADILDAIGDGGYSLWTAYDKFAEVRKEFMVKTNAAYDPKRIAALVEALSEDGAAEALVDNPALVTAYGALADVLKIIGEQAAVLKAEREAEAA